MDKIYRKYVLYCIVWPCSSQLKREYSMFLFALTRVLLPNVLNGQIFKFLCVLCLFLFLFRFLSFLCLCHHFMIGFIDSSNTSIIDDIRMHWARPNKFHFQRISTVNRRWAIKHRQAIKCQHSMYVAVWWQNVIVHKTWSMQHLSH